MTLEDPADMATYPMVAEKFVRTLSATGRSAAQAEALLEDLELAVKEQTVDMLNDVLTGGERR